MVSPNIMLHSERSLPIGLLVSHFIGKCQCKYAVSFKMKSREEIKDATDQSGVALQNTVTGLL